MPYINTPDELKHHGVEGMHWHERKYQYLDGTLTPEGRIHYGYGDSRSSGSNDKRYEKKANKIEKKKQGRS